MKFRERYESMGLQLIDPNTFQYQDRFSCVRYIQLQNMHNQEETPVLGVYTKPNRPETSYRFQTTVSEEYEFQGNEVINEGIRSSIREFGSPIFEEFVILSPNLTSMRAEILVRNSSSVPAVGDVYPQITILNSYNGTSAKKISFGISLYQGGKRIVGFSFGITKLLVMRQIHIQNARTFASTISSYVNLFTENIVDLIRINMQNRLDESTILSTLDLVENIGKRKRAEISNMLTEITKESGNSLTGWDLFLAITKFSTVETNINSKTLLENIAERVLVLPESMFRVLS